MSETISLIISVDDQGTAVVQSFQKNVTAAGASAEDTGARTAKAGEAGRLGFFALGNAVEDTARSFGVAGQASRQMGNSIERVAATAFPMWGTALGVGVLAVTAVVSIVQKFNEELQQSREEIKKAGDAALGWIETAYKEEIQTKALTEAIIAQTAAKREQAAFDIDRKRIQDKQLLIEKQQQINDLEREAAELEERMGEEAAPWLAVSVAKKSEQIDQLNRDINQLKADIRVEEERGKQAKTPTTQERVGQGAFTEEDFRNMQEWMQKEREMETLSAEGFAAVREMRDREDAEKRTQQTLEFEADRLGAVDALWSSEDANYQGHLDMQMAAYDAHITAKLTAMSMAGASAEQISEAWTIAELHKNAVILADDQKVAAAKRALQVGTLDNFTNAAQTMASIGGRENRKYFEIAKIGSIAQATINTYEGATKALSQGGIWGYALAAAVIAAGLAQVAKIQSTQYGSSGSGGSIGTYSADSFSGMDLSKQPNASAEKPAQNITIIVNSPMAQENWDRIAEEDIIPALTRAGDRNVTVTVK
jgi:hypothetical protein